MKKKHILALSLTCAAASAAFVHADGDISVVLNGTRMVFDVQPTLINSRTMVPMRVIFEALGYSVAWNGEKKTITAVNGKTNTTITMTLEKNEMTCNDKKITLDSPPTLVNDRTLVPVRAVSESSGCEVKWDGTTKTVTIVDPTVTYIAPPEPDPTPTPVPTPTPEPTPTPTPKEVYYEKTSVPSYGKSSAKPISSTEGRRMYYYTNSAASEGRKAFRSYIQKLRDEGFHDESRITLRNELGAVLTSKDGTYTVVVATEYRSITEFDAATTFRAYVVLIDNTVEDKDEYTAEKAAGKHYDNTSVPRVEEVTGTILNKRLFVKSKLNQYWPAYKYSVQMGNFDAYQKELSDGGYTRCSGAHVLYNNSYPCYVSHSLSEIVAVYSSNGYMYIVPESLFSEK